MYIASGLEKFTTNAANKAVTDIHRCAKVRLTESLENCIMCILILITLCAFNWASVQGPGGYINCACMCHV